MGEHGPAFEVEGARDRTGFALTEFGAALVLLASFFVPWYFIDTSGAITWLGPEGFSPASLTTGDLLTAYVPIFALVITLVALALPARPARVAVLVAFAAAVWAASLDFWEVVAGDRSGWAVPPAPGPGLWLYASASVIGLVAVIADLARGGSSTALSRAMGRPRARRIGPWLVYGAILAVTLPVALFPMFPRWWLLVWLAALACGPAWALARRRSS